nr:PASTA domain-containing protein [Thermoleophilaceae bacterium]
APAPPDPAGDTVRCATGLEDCTQGDTAVSAPPEGGTCEIEGSPGTWAQIDRGGADTIYACLLDENPPSLPAGEPSTVPDLTDVGLDFADSILSRQGLDYEPVGDDLFGLIDSEALTVCQTDPEAGAAVETGDEVTLFIDSSC